MRGSRLPQGTFHLIRQRQWDCCDRSCLDLAFGSILGNADFSIKERPVVSSLESKVNGDTVDICSQIDQAYVQTPEHHSGLLAFRSDPQSRRSALEREGLKSGRRWYSSAAGDADRPPGRGRGLGFLGDFTGNGIGGSSQAGTEQDAVSLNAAEGQFEDNENEKREKPATPGSVLQQILAAASKEQAEAVRQAREQPNASAQSNGRSTAVGRLNTHAFKRVQEDLIIRRMFESKTGPPSDDPAKAGGGLFRPRRSSDASQISTLSQAREAPPMRCELDNIAPVTPLGYGERSSLVGDKRDPNLGHGSKAGGLGEDWAPAPSLPKKPEDKERAPLSLSEIFARSKAQEGEEKTDLGARMMYKREASGGRGKPMASLDFRQRVLGLPPEEVSSSANEGLKRWEQPGQGRGSRTTGFPGTRTSIGRRVEEDDDRPPQYGELAINSTRPDDKPRKERPPKRAVDRETFERREAEKEEKELLEGAKETAEEIENSEWYDAMRKGWEPQPGEMGLPHIPELAMRDHLSLSLEPEYTMETFGVLPELDEPPTTSVEDALTACKEELMAMSGIEDEETWQAMLKRTLGRTSELEGLIKRYNPNKSAQVTAKQQHQILGDIYKEIPEQGSPFRSPEMVAHVTRALQTLEHNCRWPLQRKKAVMTSLVAQLGKYDGSTKLSKLMQSTYG